MSWYLKVLWHHEFVVEPVEILSEIGEDGYEVRKVEVYRDGRLDWADAARDTDTIGLGEAPVPPLEEINAQSEFSASVIDVDEFESAWRQALAAG